jgi:hypothetical protein
MPTRKRFAERSDLDVTRNPNENLLWNLAGAIDTCPVSLRSTCLRILLAEKRRDLLGTKPATPVTPFDCLAGGIPLARVNVPSRQAEGSTYSSGGLTRYDELATEAEIAQLEVSPNRSREERHALLCLMGTGPAIDLATRRDDAIRASGSRSSDATKRANRAAQSPRTTHTVARCRLARAELEAAESGERSQGADGALAAQVIRAVGGSDVGSALERLEIELAIRAHKYLI